MEVFKLDKTKIKELFIHLLKIYSILILLSFPFIIIFNILMGFNNGNLTLLVLFKNIFISFTSTFIIFIGLSIFMILILYLIKFYNNIIRFKNTPKTKEYCREIPNNYPPAIVSAILDQNIEITTDYPATIAYLCTQKYIEMNEENNEINFYLLNNNTSQLYSHELYVLDCIINNQTFVNNDFKERIKRDLKKLGLMEERKKNFNFIKNIRNICISFALFFLSVILSSLIPESNIHLINLTNIFSFICILLIFTTIVCSFFLPNNYYNYYRTTKADIEAQKWSGLKNFLHDYTLIAEKDLNYSTILEDYIPYAISLGEGKSIEKYISSNKLYRKLLYKHNF